MNKRLTESLELIVLEEFPGTPRRSSKRYSAIIGVGGNVGNMIRRFKRLLRYLEHYPFIDVTATSPLLKNPPFGYLDQPDFINAVFEIRTDLLPTQLMHHLLRIEKRFGRQRSFKNAPRTLDLDIIFFESKKVYNKTVTIPHPHWHTRESVLIPMNYLSNRRR